MGGVSIDGTVAEDVRTPAEKLRKLTGKDRFKKEKAKKEKAKKEKAKKEKAKKEKAKKEKVKKEKVKKEKVKKDAPPEDEEGNGRGPGARAGELPTTAPNDGGEDQLELTCRPPGDVPASSADDLTPDVTAQDGSVSVDAAALRVLIDQFDDRVADLVQRMPRSDQRAIATALGMRVDPRFMRSRFGARVLERLRTAPLSVSVDALSFLAFVIDRDVATTLDWYDLGRLDALSDDHFAELLALIEQRSTPALAAAWAFTAGTAHQHRRALELFDLWVEQHRAGRDDIDGRTDPRTKDEPEAERPGPGGEVLRRPELFSPLDQLLIRTAVATATGVLGAPDAEELAGTVDELIRLNADRRQSWFHAGFCEVLCGVSLTLPAEAANGERRSWYRFGRLNGLIRHGETAVICDELQLVVTDHPNLLSDDLTAAAVAVPCILAALDERRWDLVAATLELAPRALTDGGRMFLAVYDAARDLAAGEDPRTADRLFSALGRHAEAAVGLEGNDGPFADVADVRADLARRRSASLRSLNRFDNALEVMASLEPPTSDWVRAILAAEQGFIATKVGHLTHLKPPAGDDAAATLAERLATGEQCFREALRLDPEQHRAAFALGMLAVSRGDWSGAAEPLAIAARGFARDSSPAAARLAALAGCLRAIADLAGTDLGIAGPAYAAIVDGLRSGATVPDRLIDTAARYLAVRDPELALRLIQDAIDSGRRPSSLAEAVLEILANDPTEAALDLLAEMLKDRTLEPSTRLTFCVRALEGTRDDGTVDWLMGQAEHLVARSSDPRLEDEWSLALVTRPRLLELLGEAAHFARLSSLQRAGRYEDAIAVATSLFHRAVGGESAAGTPEDLLDLITHLGAADEVVDGLRRRLPPADAGAPQPTTGPVRLLWVGGDERQARYQSALDRQIEERWGGTVTVRWWFPGWSANWGHVADEVERELARADALLLSYFVRTNLGRRLRRSSGDAEVVWVPASGHGHAALLRAVEEGVSVVERLRCARGAE
jgi:tetratricopeptide (TPR) repeat protein